MNPLAKNILLPTAQAVLESLDNKDSPTIVQGLAAALDDSFVECLALAMRQKGLPMRASSVFIGTLDNLDEVQDYLQALEARDQLSTEQGNPTFFVDLGCATTAESIETLTSLSHVGLLQKVVFLSRSAEGQFQGSTIPMPALTEAQEKEVYLWAARRSCTRPKLPANQSELLKASRGEMRQLIHLGHHGHLTLDDYDESPLPTYLAQSLDADSRRLLELTSELPQPLCQTALRYALNQVFGVARSTAWLSTLRNRGWLNEPYGQSSERALMWYFSSPLTSEPPDPAHLRALTLHYADGLEQAIESRVTHREPFSAASFSLCAHAIEVINWASLHDPVPAAKLATHLEYTAASTGQLRALGRAIADNSSATLVQLKTRIELALNTGFSELLKPKGPQHDQCPETQLLNIRIKATQTGLEELAQSLLELSSPEMLVESTSARNAGLMLGQHYTYVGQLDDAIHIGESIARAAQINRDILGMGLARVLLGNAHSLKNSDQKLSASYFFEGIKHFSTLGLTRQLAYAQHSLAKDLERRGLKEQAQHWAQLARRGYTESLNDSVDSPANTVLLDGPVWAQ